MMTWSVAAVEATKKRSVKQRERKETQREQGGDSPSQNLWASSECRIERLADKE